LFCKDFLPYFNTGKSYSSPQKMKHHEKENRSKADAEKDNPHQPARRSGNGSKGRPFTQNIFMHAEGYLQPVYLRRYSLYRRLVPGRAVCSIARLFSAIARL
jgi:hypothetical protein